MSLPEDINEGEISHVGHHELLHVRYNNSVEVLSGTTAARPAASAVDVGTLYWDTDTELLYRSTGAVWDQLSAGVADHGALTGLGDDDHPQYLTQSEGDSLYHLQGDIAVHAAGADPHTVYRLESADHSHQSTGLQGGTLDHGLALTGLSDNDHPQYLLATAAPTYVYKTADEVVNNSIAFQDDDHLFFTIDANGVYVFEFFLDYFSGSTPDIKVEWVEPDGTFTIRTFYDNSADAAQNINRTETTALWSAGGAGVSTANSIYGVGVIRAGGTGGTFKLQWAQSVANASDTTLRKGSWLKYKKLN